VTRKPRYELLPAEPSTAGRAACTIGARYIPRPEGDRQGEHGWFDYLFGYAYPRCERSRRLRGDWRVTAEEKAAFERLIDGIIERRATILACTSINTPPYEPTARKRLMGRYANEGRRAG